jgi:putative colanic acid biosynthesis acetyltransferase WcaF
MMIDGYSTNRKVQFGERLFNWLVTYIPSHTIRQGFLRFFGATIGAGTSIMMGTTVFGLNRLVIGDNCSIGFGVLLDARGGITIDDDVVFASDVHIITAKHIIDSDDFAAVVEPVYIKHHAWLASRSTVLLGVTIGVGAVVGACSLVNSDVDDMAIVAGTPAKLRAKRESSLDYHPNFRPLLY